MTEIDWTINDADAPLEASVGTLRNRIVLALHTEIGHRDAHLLAAFDEGLIPRLMVAQENFLQSRQQDSPFADSLESNRAELARLTQRFVDVLPAFGEDMDLASHLLAAGLMAICPARRYYDQTLALEDAQGMLGAFYNPDAALSQSARQETQQAVARIFALE